MSLRPEILTWTALLSKWMEFAQASLAIPADESGDAWRESVVPIIELQAVTCALGEIGSLPETERPVAADKAAIMIDRAESALERAWAEAEQPDLVQEILQDARLAHHAVVAARAV